MASRNESTGFRRPCIRCNKYFQPTGRSCKVCDECKKPIAYIDKYKKKYFDNKEELNKLRDNVTLERWKILSENYKLGKKIWKHKFSREKLAKDMDMAYSTVLRCLALDKANKRSWKLVKQGKLSVFKLAMVCQLKNSKYQDKIVDIVISDKISTYQIKKFKINNISDINKIRHLLAVEEGYSRKSSAYYNFKTWIERGKIFMLMSPEFLPKDKIQEIKDKLEVLNRNIKFYVKEKL